MRKDKKKVKAKKKTARKKTVSKRKGTKRKGVRHKRSAKKEGVGWFGRIWRLALLIAGVCLGLLVPWTAYLNHQVTTEFEGRKWDLPSRVYSRALDLYPGLPITLNGLELELSIARYLRKTNADRPGLYSVSGNTLEIYRRSFRFHDGVEDALHFSVQFQSGKVGSVSEVGSGKSLDLVRLEPAEIAAIYPLHKEDRTLVRIKHAPPLLLTGLQAVEDRNFKHHPGVDLKGIARAASSVMPVPANW